MVSVHFTHSALISAYIDLDQGVGRSHIWPIVAREGSSKEIRVIEQEVPRLTAPEQIVFSGTGFSQSANTPIYFCIWCESDSSNPYVGQCNGSMSFSAFHLTKHVGDMKPIQEVADGQYVMTVASSDGTVSCTLENDLPVTSRPTNAVHTICTAPAIPDGRSTNAVVKVTGL